MQNLTQSGTVLWQVAGEFEAIVVSPGQSQFISLSSQGDYEATWSVDFSGPLPVAGEKVSFTVIETSRNPHREDVALSEYVLDVGGEIFGQPTQVAFILVDSSGEPLNINTQCTPNFIPPLDLNQVSGTFLVSEDIPFTEPVSEAEPVPTITEWGIIITGLLLLTLGSAALRAVNR